MKKIFTILILVFFAVTLSGQSPEAFKYQAVVRDNGGSLVENSSVGFRITILQTSETGTPVYTETHTATTNEYGLVTLTIGDGSSGDDFSTIDWGSDEFFVKIEADLAGGTSYQHMGTSQLLSVPYALHAKTAENGFSGDYNDLTNKPSILNSQWNNSNNNIFYNTGWVGIGTSSINHPLTISNANNTSYIKLFDNQGTDGMRLGAYLGSMAFVNDNVNKDIIFTIRSTSSYSKRLTISGTTGNIGIGDETPDASLDVEGTVRVGVNGINITEIREVTGTTASAGGVTSFSYPSGYTNENTRVLSLEINYSGTHWNTLGMSYASLTKSVGIAMSSTVMYIHYPDVSVYHSRAFRMVLMKVQ